jgi:hypothetical protein
MLPVSLNTITPKHKLRARSRIVGPWGAAHAWVWGVWVWDAGVEPYWRLAKQHSQCGVRVRIAPGVRPFVHLPAATPIRGAVGLGPVHETTFPRGRAQQAPSLCPSYAAYDLQEGCLAAGHAAKVPDFWEASSTSASRPLAMHPA